MLKGELSHWNIYEPQDDDLIKSMYINRKYSDSFDKYLRNNIADYWPKTLINLDIALKICFDAIQNNITIGIVGDYDADGSIATSMLIRFFKKYNISYKAKIPNRFVDGYGITPKIIHELNTKIIITVDNGTSAYEAINEAEKNNIELIILDHHVISKEISVKAFVNPCQDNSIIGSPCAAGLTFFFLGELNKILGKKFDMKYFLSFAAIATICDCVPLEGFNRAIVSLGIEQLNTNPPLAFKHMINSEVDVYTIGFNIGPLINVSGRFGQTEKIIALLTSDEEKEVEILIAQIAALNIERRALDEKIFKEADKQQSFSFCKVYYGEWHEGVIGIVSGKLTQKYNCPTIVMSENKSYFKASARSIKGFNIAALIKEGIYRGIISFGGGHAMAGGFTLNKDKLTEFLSFVEEYSNTYRISTDLIYDVDAIISLHAINNDFYSQIAQLGPFGMNNNIPIFCIPNCIITNTKVISFQHLLISFTDKFKTKTLSSIIFNFNESKLVNIPINQEISLLISLSMYKKNVSICIIDYLQVV